MKSKIKRLRTAGWMLPETTLDWWIAGLMIGIGVGALAVRIALGGAP